MSVADSSVRRRMVLPLASALVALALVGSGCDDKKTVQVVSATTAKPSTLIGDKGTDPKIAKAVAAAAEAAKAVAPRPGKAPPLPAGHQNTLPPGHPPIEGMAQERQVAAQPKKLPGMDGPKGPVAEVLYAGRYTYLRIGNEWSAVPMAKVKVGQQVAIVGAMKMKNFVSKATKRTFKEVWFGHVQVAGGKKPSKPKSPKIGPKVEKATGEGAHTVAEVHAAKTALGGKVVRVRGKVVKFNAGILERNWLHIQDGSGSDGDHDITITSQERAAVGDVVTVTGTVVLGKDFGAGYKYAVLIEKATISK
ncbi:MAG: hypothetical protein KC502_07590, partial [Myxococcales bacterium]|nr:hypothetical protein [Myxococcales bacterium]